MISQVRIYMLLYNLNLVKAHPDTPEELENLFPPVELDDHNKDVG